MAEKIPAPVAELVQRLNEMADGIVNLVHLAELLTQRMDVLESRLDKLETIVDKVRTD